MPLSINLETAIHNYIQSLNEIETIVLNVAKQQLESSFELHKSIGFLKYIKDNDILIT